MLNLRREDVKKLKEQYKKGTEVVLINMEGEHLPNGLEGTVNFVDDAGQIHVNWNNGSTLALDVSLDKFILKNDALK